MREEVLRICKQPMCLFEMLSQMGVAMELLKQLVKEEQFEDCNYFRTAVTSELLVLHLWVVLTCSLTYARC